MIVYLGVGSDEDGGINLVGFVFIGLQLLVMVVACGIALSDLSHEKEYVVRQIHRSLSSLSFSQEVVPPVMAVVRLQALSRSFLARKEVEQMREERRQDQLRATHTARERTARPSPDLRFSVSTGRGSSSRSRASKKKSSNGSMSSQQAISMVVLNRNVTSQSEPRSKYGNSVTRVSYAEITAIRDDRNGRDAGPNPAAPYLV